MIPPSILCIGSVLWDIIGRSTQPMPLGADRPGRITMLPGGVALNIAMALARAGHRPALLSVLGQDPEGDALLAACANLGLDTRYLTRAEDLPTDRYMAIEGPQGLCAAVADAHSLEHAGARILAPLYDGRLGGSDAPFQGCVAMDGNLAPAVLASSATAPELSGCDLRLAPASPGKALRLVPFLGHPRAVFYTNLEEAGLICGQNLPDAASAAQLLVAKGAARALVTDGAATAADACATACYTGQPPSVSVARVTGAGDTFMAAHIAAELAGQPRDGALQQALRSAARYVSGKDTA
ncbi:MAG: PfkB family carbohydrate kinase [Lutimaribacter sp.]